MRAHLLLTVLASSVGCADRITTITGADKNLVLSITFADLDDADLTAIGVFRVHFDHGGTTSTHALNFDSQSRELSWVSEPDPTELPRSGLLTIRLHAIDVSSNEVPIGGAAGPIDLDALAEDETLRVPVVITTLEAFTGLGIDLAAPRFHHTATATADGGILFVGGAATGDPDSPSGFVDDAEWLVPAAKSICSSGATACGVWGDTPPARIEHVAVALADGFAETCAHRGRIFVGLGRSESGSALSDTFLFDAAGLQGGGAFEELTLGLTPRIAAAAFATRGCRVVIAGGHPEGSTVPIDTVEVIDFNSSPPQLEPTTLTMTVPASGAAILRLANALDEVVVFGGTGATGAATGSAALFSSTGAGAVELCNPGSGCANEVESMLCARAAPQVVMLDPDDPLKPSLVVGDLGGTCDGAGQALELFRSGTELTPYSRFIQVGVGFTINRGRGHTVSRYTNGSALVVGGFDDSAALTNSVEALILGDGLTESDTAAAASVASLVLLESARAYHTAVTVGAATLIAGGYTTAGATGEIAVIAAVP